MAYLADDFDMYGLDKEGLQFMLFGELTEDIEAGASEVEVAPDGKTATAEGVSEVYSFKLEKRNGKWLIVSIEEQY